MHIEVLVEDSSGAALMGHLMPKLLGEAASEHTWRIHNYKGIGRIPKKMAPHTDAAKKTLLDNLPRLLEGYGQTPGYDAVLVLVDTDDRNVAAFHHELKQVLAQCPHAPQTVFRGQGSVAGGLPPGRQKGAEQVPARCRLWHLGNAGRCLGQGWGSRPQKTGFSQGGRVQT